MVLSLKDLVRQKREERTYGWIGEVLHAAFEQRALFHLVKELLVTNDNPNAHRQIS